MSVTSHEDLITVMLTAVRNIL